MSLASINMFTPLWITWITLAVGGFGTIEGTALWARKGNPRIGNGTLSALVWRITSARNHPLIRRWFFTVYVLGFGVLGSHFAWHMP